MSAVKVREEHPFFHAMVLMGSSIALGCGGNARDSTGQGHSIDDPPGGGGSSGGFSAETGGSMSSGGEPIITATGGAHAASGGASAGGMNAAGGRGAGGVITLAGGTGAGGLVPASGGSSSGGISSTLPCPSQQWSCGALENSCTHGVLWRADLAKCTCDGSRPLSSDQCPSGQVSVCTVFTRTDDDVSLTPPLATGCSCVTPADTCPSTCDQAFLEKEGHFTCVDSRDNYLCSCAVVVLR